MNTPPGPPEPTGGEGGRQPPGAAALPGRFEPGPWLALVATAAGIWLGERAGPGAALAPLVAGLLGLGGAWLLTGRARAAVAALALLLLGGAVTQRALDGLTHSPLTGPVAARAEVRLVGTLVDDPWLGRYRASATVRVSEFTARAGRTSAAGAAAVPPVRAVAGGGRLVLVAASGDEANRLGVLAAGDHVVVTGGLEPLDGYDARARWRHVVARLSGARVHGFDGPRGGVAALVNRLRDLLRRGAQPLPPVERALLAGFLLGDTRALPDELVDDFRASGMSHLLAVSGANVAFVLALAGPLLRRLGLGGRLTAGLAIVAFFAALTRYEPSVLRASTMAALTMLAAFSGRPAAAARVLAIAATVLLLADPFLLHSMAFALSCAASAGLVLFSGPIARRLSGPRWLREPLAVTLAAQAGVAPLLLAGFGGLPAAAPLANLLAVPVAEPLTVYGLPATLAAGLIDVAAPRMAEIVQLPTRAALAWVEAVAHAAARTSPVLTPRAFAATIAAAAAATAVRVGRRGSLRRDERGTRAGTFHPSCAGGPAGALPQPPPR